MEIKKSAKANLDNYKSIFVEVGLVVSLLFMIVAFNWSSSGEVSAVLQDQKQEIEEEIDVPITEDTPPPPPEQIEMPVLQTDDFTIVDDDTEVPSFNFNSEGSEDFEIPDIPNIPTNTQPKEEETFEEDIVYDVVQEKPKFKGGDQNDFSKWVAENIVYPPVALENGRSGKVYLQFRVGTDGKVSNVKVLRGVDPALDKEAVRVVSMSPQWTPGKQHNRNVGVLFTFPVNFTLTN